MTNLREIFAYNLKAKRRKYGITQAKLAEKVGVSTHHIAMIEIARHYPTLELVERIANTLDIEIYELFIVKPTPENALERLHQEVLQDIKQVVGEAVEKAVAAQQPHTPRTV
jgi:transcriptional regulator with XRE-family HTH domain